MKTLVLEHPRISSETRFNDIANTPLWSCLMGGYAAAALRAAGHEVDYIDAPAEGWDFPKTQIGILNRSPDLLCVNAVYFWEHTPRLFELFHHLRGEGFHGHIHLFGFFPTLAHRAILTHAAPVDSIAVGECEKSVCELAEALARGDTLSGIEGLVFRKGDRMVDNGWRRPSPDPDEFPLPLRRPRPGETAMLLASRGCYNQCAFCPVPAFYHQGPLWRGRSPDSVIREMALLREQGADTFYFTDPNFVGPGRKGRTRALAMAGGIRPLGVRFGMETRPNDLDDDLMTRLRDAGLTSLLLGVESGSAAALDALDKHVSGAVAERAIACCRNAGIEPEIGFLMFVPDGTLADLAANFQFLRCNRLLDRLDRTANLLSHRQIVLTGTSGYRRFAEKGRLIPTGPFGFEGAVAYGDPRVAWMADIVTPVCLAVLRETGRPASPLFWEKGVSGAPREEVNHRLVTMFATLLTTARKSGPPPPAETVREEIMASLAPLFTSAPASPTTCQGG